MTGWDDIFVRRLTSPFRGMSGRGALVAWLCAAASLPSVLLQDKVAAAAWHLGLAVHWQWAYLVGGLIGCGFALLDRRWHVLIAAAIIVVAWSQTSPSIDRGDATKGPALSVATANLNYENQDFRRLEDWLTSADAPDVVVLQEFTEGAQEAVQRPALTAAYPHRLLAPQEDPFGLAILSRLPLVGNERVEPAVHTATLALRSATYWQGRVVALSALHPMPPLSAEYAAARNQAIQQEARRLGTLGVPALLAGDLNDTPWSTGLRGAAPYMARANDLRPTWPNSEGWLSFLPLDHVLATTHWMALDSEIGPDLGSDHRPVIVRLRLKETEARR